MKTAKKLVTRIGKIFFLLFMLTIFAALGVMGVIAYYSKGLPSSEELANYQPKTMTRLYDARGGLLAEYGHEKRVYVPISKTPELVKQAFIAAEDQNFYDHPGVDILGITRAMVNNVQTKLTGSGSISGASTITQQVIKNILLDNSRTYDRKIKEAILALRISKSVSKDRVLEIYLNVIYLGNRSYGIGAAAQRYFDKSVTDLNLQEAAFLAALPKGPADYDPRKYYDRAKVRRDWVLERMKDENYITEKDAEAAKKTPIELADIEDEEIVTTHFAEEVRRYLEKEYGTDKLYEGGMVVRTTLDPKIQKYAERALYKGIIDYDRNHGWRGAIGKIDDLDLWRELLAEMKDPEGLGPWQLAVVLEVRGDRVIIGLKDGNQSYIPFENMKWAKKTLPNQRWAGTPSSPREVVNIGDIIAVSKSEKNKSDGKKEEYFALEQIPNVNGAITVMDPQTGRVLAMVGGYIYGDSHFNRATQAKRQPGSAFKPFVYLAALENGFTPATVIEDGPIEIPQGRGMPTWTPKNYSGDYLGFVSLRKGLEKSRNNMTILVSLMLGIDKIQEIATRFGILEDPKPYYSMALGASETTLLKLTTAYSAIANGGRKVEPKIIDKIQNNLGKTLYISDKRICSGCVGSLNKNQIPTITDNAEQLTNPVIAYQLTSMLEGVVQRGTAVRAKVIGKPLAGKTGTTNKSFDTWFMGFSPDLVVGTYIGFDRPRTLGAKDTGSSVALPVFIEFMTKALADIPAKPFPAPDGVTMVKVDITTGAEPTEYSAPENIRYEVFNPVAPMIDYSQDYMEYQDNRRTLEEEIYDGSFSTGIY